MASVLLMMLALWAELMVRHTYAQGAGSECIDKNEHCQFWALEGQGQCQSNPAYMLHTCPKACKQCGEQDVQNGSECFDNDEQCQGWALAGQCHSTPDYMLHYCPKACNQCSSECIDKNEHCQYWALEGQCQSNPNYMLIFCPKACNHQCGPEIAPGDVGGERPVDAEDVVVAVALGEAFPRAREGFEYGPPAPPQEYAPPPPEYAPVPHIPTPQEYAPPPPAYAPVPHIPVLQDDRSTKTGYGEYSFTYKTGNDITRTESGSQNDGQVSSGGWNYISPEGIPINLNFVANHGGYQPEGAHLPIAPVHYYELPIAPELPYKRTDEFLH